MAKKPQKFKAICYVNGEKYCEVDPETREVTWFKPQEEFERCKEKMMENVGRNMSWYLQRHPESTLWNS